MRNNKKTKIISFILVLSMILSFGAVFASAAGTQVGEEDSDGVNVIYNRSFEEGWDYTNGLSVGKKGGNKYTLPYTQMSPSFYNYYLKIETTDNEESYLVLDTGESVVSEGALFFSLDVMAEGGTDIAGAVSMRTAGEGKDSELIHVMSFIDGYIYLFGKKIMKCDGGWQNVAFKIDFDYAKTNKNTAEPNDFRITAFYGKNESFSEIFNCGTGGFGISEVLIGAGADENAKREGHWYALDNIKLYSGTESFSDLKGLGCGSAVDEESVRDFEILGVSTSIDYLSGAPTLERENISLDKLTVDRTGNGRFKSGAQYILYNRHFGEGWTYDNGVNPYSIKNNARGNTFEIRYDYNSKVNKSDNYRNHYLYLEKLNTQNGFIFFAPGTYTDSVLAPAENGKLFLEFDLKASVGINTDDAIEMLITATEYSIIMEFIDGHLYLLGQDVGVIGEEWLHVIFEIDFDAQDIPKDPNNPDAVEKLPEKFTVTAYYGENGDSVMRDDLKFGSVRGIHTFRLGFASKHADAIGNWYALDNLQMYYGTDKPANLPKDNFGELVDTAKDKNFALGPGASDADSSGAVSAADVYESSLTMKLNVDHCLLFGERTPIFEAEDGTAYGAPLKIDGKVMLPLLAIADFAGAITMPHSDGVTFELLYASQVIHMTLGSTDATIDGKRVILTAAPAVISAGDEEYILVAMDDLELFFKGLYATYDDMGLVTVSEYKDFINRDMDGALEKMVDIMRRFVFDFPSGEEIYNLAKENTDNFNHPYLFVDEDRFSYLREKFSKKPGEEGFDQELVRYITNLVEQATERVAWMAEYDEYGNYLGLTKDKSSKYYTHTSNPYAATGGYDPEGGRLNILYNANYTGALQLFAFAYQMTLDKEYAAIAMDLAYAVCQWEHWGPAHMLNCAEPAMNIAICYDWCYDAWGEIDAERRDFIAAKLYENGVYEGWRTANGLASEHPRPAGFSEGVLYNQKGDNWNAVCSAGMVITSLAILDSEDEIVLEKAKYLIESDIKTCVTNGLILLAPDGSCSESSGYWGATVNSHLYLTAALIGTTGDDFGNLDVWGMDKTFYFAINIESSDYVSWNYHDAEIDSMGVTMLNFYASQVGDSTLLEIRKNQLLNDKKVYIWDIIYYPEEEALTDTDLPLSYYMEGIEAYTARSSWDKGALFTGVMGGYNKASHGNVDSGNFIYYNEGVIWFCDLGMGEYNAYQYFGNYNLYKRGGEGQNIVIVANNENKGLPYGQQLEGEGEIYAYGENEFGSYALLDNFSAYGEGVVSSAKRGIMLTNDRKTVVLQDEIAFRKMTDSYWFAHYEMISAAKTVYGRIVDVKLGEAVGEDNNVAYLYGRNNDGELFTLRAKIVTNMRGIKFQIWDCYTFVLDGTFKKGQSESLGAAPEMDRSGYGKLVIEARNQQNLDIAVVMELIDTEKKTDVGYTWTPMDEWSPYADTRLDVKEEASVTRRQNPKIHAVSESVKMIKTFSEKDLFSIRFEDYYNELAEAEYAISRFGRDTIAANEMLAPDLLEYDSYKARYDGFIRNATAAQTASNAIVALLICPPSAAEEIN